MACQHNGALHSDNMLKVAYLFLTLLKLHWDTQIKYSFSLDVSCLGGVVRHGHTAGMLGELWC